MMVQVRLFARARDLAGTGVLSVELPTQATAGDLRRHLGTAHPALRGLLARSALALNNELVQDEVLLPPGSEIALLPPVSGGAPDYAISLKQPWAALLTHGRKTIEIRNWSTTRRGRVLIHAAREPDEREYGWSLVPSELKEATQVLGGIVGVGEIQACIRYRTLPGFRLDQAKHLNDLEWFKPGVYGFIFRNAQPLPFRPYPGSTRFFVVEEGEVRSE